MILYAININSGGGKVLLDELLTRAPFGRFSVLFIDERYHLPSEFSTKDCRILKIKPNIAQRWKAERTLKKISSENPELNVFCFGNLPPAITPCSKTIVYLQNAFLLDQVPIPKDSFKVFLRNLYERLWFKLFIKNADEIWVQIQWMKDSLPIKLRDKTKLKPFLPTFPPRLSGELKIYEFVAVTGSLRHKNLIHLLKGIKLAGIKNKKFLIITEELSSEMQALVQEIQESLIDLEVKINVPRNEVLKRISQSKCMIITSQLESFCLPLHEAIHYGLDIIAGNFPFISEYVKDYYIIDVNSEASIADSLCSATNNSN